MLARYGKRERERHITYRVAGDITIMSLVNVSSNAYYGYVQQYARANQRLNHVGVTKDDLVAKLTDATTAMDVDGDCRKGAVASLGIYSITDRSFDENLRLAINDRWLRRNDSRKRRNGEQEPGVERKRHCTGREELLIIGPARTRRLTSRL